MTRQEFIDHLKNPVDLTFEDMSGVKDLAIRFPYCASAQILYAYGLYKKEDIDFSGQWKKMAAYASNRRKIKMDLDRLKTSRSIHKIPVVNEPSSQKPELHQPTHEDELLAIVRRRLAEIKAEQAEALISKDEQSLKTTSWPVIEQSIKDHEELLSSKKITTKNELVEKFIQEAPRISSPKGNFFSPAEKEASSGFDAEEIVSETLAQLYYRQGNVHKAIKIYEKLILLYPEKSSFFAAQIKKLE
ncbi:MAG: tetratricopeptide repeat protein [Bacteroidetes bacterium]|nr:tetratricopeptide repeat protein [Bacteroidota bacterium]